MRRGAWDYTEGGALLKTNIRSRLFLDLTGLISVTKLKSRVATHLGRTAGRPVCRRAYATMYVGIPLSIHGLFKAV